MLNVSKKLKNTTLLIELPAKGFLPNASTLLPEIRPKDMKPIIKLAPVTSVANIYLRVIMGDKNGDSSPDFKADNTFVVPDIDIN